MNGSTILLAGLALGLAGCMTVETADLPGTERGRHVLVRNVGKYLFNCVPMGCGNMSDDPTCRFVMFRDDVTMDKVQHRFLAECGKAGGNVTDVVYHSENDIFLQIPLFSISIPVPYVWTTREIQITGVVK